MADSRPIHRRWLFRRCIQPGVVAAVLASAASGPAAAQTTTLLGLHGTVPNDWKAVPPSSSSRLAQFVIGDPGPTSAEVVVFFFGPQQGGNLDANLARWRGQFSTPDGSPVPERISHDSSGTFPVDIAEFQGTYRRGVGMGSADSVRTGQSLIATIVTTPRGTLFIQLFGPIARVQTQRDAFLRFVKTLRE